MLCKTDGEVWELVSDAKKHGRLADELADVMVFALLLADAADIDPVEAICRKLKKNARNYPAHLARGRADKYDELDQGGGP